MDKEIGVCVKDHGPNEKKQHKVAQIVEKHQRNLNQIYLLDVILLSGVRLQCLL